MKLFTYFLGSLFIIRSIFRFSYVTTNYLFEKNILDIPKYKFEKIHECIYSSMHGVLVSTMASFSIKNSLFDYYKIYNDNSIKIYEKDNELQYLTASFCLSYFIIDLLKCIYEKKYLFILHHLAAINLLTLTFYSFYNNENKGFYAMYLIFLLESNTFLLNIGFLLKEFKFHYSITCLSWIIHLYFFVLFRLVTIPRIIFIYYYNESLTLKSITELPSFILILAGSVYWSYRQTIGINKYLKENCVI
jgi:hypothetical protein